MLTNAQYNQLIDTLTIQQLDELSATQFKVARSAGFPVKSVYPCTWIMDEDAFLQIAYAAIVACGFSLESVQ